MSSDTLISTTKQFTYLTKEFERIANELNQRSFGASESLNSTMTQISHDIRKLLDETSTTLQREARHAMNNAADTSLRELEQRLHQLCDRVDDSAERIEAAAAISIRQTKLIGWMSLVGAWLVSLSVMGLSVWMIAN